MKTLLTSALLLAATPLAQANPSAAVFQAGPNRVTFPSGGETLVGTLFLPEGHTPGRKYPALLVEGPWTQVKEQVGYRYARELVKFGYAVLTFDPRFFGESGGQPRQYESPRHKLEDLQNALSFLQTLPVVEADRLGGVGVCFGASYLARLAATDPRLKSLALVASWLHDEASIKTLYGEDGFQTRLDAGRRAMATFLKTGKVAYALAYGPVGSSAAMQGPFDYYSNPQRGAIPAWENKFAEMSWEDWLRFDAVRDAARIQVPTLMVHSDESALPENARRFYANLAGPRQLVWTKGQHVDFYDRDAEVTTAVEALRPHFDQTLNSFSSNQPMHTQMILDAVNGVFIHSDNRNWEGVRTSFADQVVLNYTSMAGGQPGTLSPEQIVAAWRELLPGFQSTHHQLGNYQVREDGDAAMVFCYGTATHYLPNESARNLWTVVGTYDFHLVKRGEDWKVDAMTFHFKYQDGNTQLPELARQKVATR